MCVSSNGAPLSYGSIFSILLDVTIGFSQTSYTTNENDAEITLTIINYGSVTLKKEVLLNVSTHDNSAVGKFTATSKL